MSKKGVQRTIDVSKLSPSLLALNQHLLVPYSPGTKGAAIEPSQKPGKKRKEMNKTEGSFSRLLESQVTRGEIISFDYESIMFRWGTKDVIRYTPDFCVTKAIYRDGVDEYPFIRYVFIEVKGAHTWAKDRQKFVQARNIFPLLEFQFWKRTDRAWTRTD